MSAVPMHRFAVRVTAAEGDAPDPDAVERFALDLRAELADAGIARIDQVTAGPAPDGARALEILAAFEFIIHMAEAGEAAAKIMRAIRDVATRLAELRHRVKVSVADVDIDLASADDQQLRTVASALMAGAPALSTGVRSALIIANKEFDDPALTQLRAPTNDANALARVLGDGSIGGFSVELLTDADERTVRRRIAEFCADRTRDDVLLLHFSGHGVKDARGRLFLTARDTKLSLLGATGIPATFVNDQLAETQSKRVVLILDCCYSGAFARGAAVRADDAVHVADEFGAGNGRIVLTASSATEYAFEGTDLTRSEAQPSAFTGALVHGLATGDADLDADGEISIDELYEYTYRMVRATTPGQAPMKWSFGVEGSLVIARSVRPAVLPQPVLDDITSDRIVLRLEAVAALARILKTGKPGLSAAAAAALVDIRDDDDSARVRAAATAALGASAETIGAAQVDAARAEAAQADSDRSAAAQAAADQAAAARTEAARVEVVRVEAERAEEVRAASVRNEAAGVEAARTEAARLDAERTEAERVEAARIDAERIEAARLDAERVEAARLDAERVEAERVEGIRVATARAEAAPAVAAPPTVAQLGVVAPAARSEANASGHSTVDERSTAVALPATDDHPTSVTATTATVPAQHRSTDPDPDADTPHADTQIPAKLETVDSAESSASTSPTPAEPTSTPETITVGTVAQPANLLLLAAGLMAIVAISLTTLGFAAASIWPDPPILLEIITVVVFLWTRRLIWGAVLVGVLTWEWIYPILVHSRNIDVALASGHRLAVLGNLVAIAAMVVGTIGLLTSNLARPARSWRRLASVFVLAPLTMITGVAVAYIVAVSLTASTTMASGWSYKIGLFAGVVVPLVMVVSPHHIVTRFVVAGWFADGLAELFNVIHEGGNVPGDVRDAFVLFLLATAVAIVIMWPRSAEARKTADETPTLGTGAAGQ